MALDAVWRHVARPGGFAASGTVCGNRRGVLRRARGAADLGDGSAWREPEKCVPTISAHDMTFEADLVGIGDFFHGMRRTPAAEGSGNLVILEVTGYAGDALMLQLRVKRRIRLQDGLPFLLVVESSDLVLLLTIERNMAVLADLQFAVKHPIHLKIGVGPSLAVDARRPLIVKLPVASGAAFGA